MSKRLGIPPKKLESSVYAQSELQSKLWDAVPMRAGENLKAWFPRAANRLGWTARRVRALWNGEARRIDWHEIETLNQRITALKTAEAQRKEQANDIRRDLEAGRPHGPVAGGQVRQHGGSTDGVGRVVPGETD